MIPIHVHAVFQPKRRKFCVRLKFNQKNLVERMTISQFLKRYLKKPEGPLVVAGTTIEFTNDEDGGAEKQIRDYLRKVAESYLVHVGGQHN